MFIGITGTGRSLLKSSLVTPARTRSLSSLGGRNFLNGPSSYTGRVLSIVPRIGYKRQSLSFSTVTSVSDYDKDGLAEKYVDMKDRNPYFDGDRRTLRELLGRIQDEYPGGVRDLTDLACGNGYYARMFQRESPYPIRIVGIDLSEDMIQDAIAMEEEENLGGISYLAGDVNDPDTVCNANGPFDVCNASYLINYFTSEESLQEVVSSVANLIKPGGYFMGLTLNPDLNLNEPQEFLHRFGACMEDLGGKVPAEGSIVTANVSMFDGTENHFPLQVAYWSFETYKRVFEQAGLDLEWVVMKPDEHKQLEQGEGEFWDKHVSVAYIAKKKTQ